MRETAAKPPQTAFVFPGQGAQYAGMGADLARAHVEAAHTFEEANDALGFDLARICFDGPEERLKETPITQPAILTVSVACWRIMRRYGWEPDVVAGLSLGEYTALVAAGAIRFSDAVKLVHKRGRFMEEAVPAGRGAMAAVLGLSREAVAEACRRAARETQGVAESVNFNCPGQVVIAGEAAAVARAGEHAASAGARRVVPLAVSGPFHSSLMAPAAERLAAELDRVEIFPATIPVVANVSGDYVRSAADIRAALVRQVNSPVLWEDGVRRMIAGGVGLFVETGPGTVLTGFLKNIVKGLAAGPAGAPANVPTGVSIQDLSTLEKLLDLREGVC